MKASCVHTALWQFQSNPEILNEVISIRSVCHLYAAPMQSMHMLCFAEQEVLPLPPLRQADLTEDDKNANLGHGATQTV